MSRSKRRPERPLLAQSRRLGSTLTGRLELTYSGHSRSSVGNVAAGEKAAGREEREGCVRRPFTVAKARRWRRTWLVWPSSGGCRNGPHIAKFGDTPLPENSLRAGRFRGKLGIEADPSLSSESPRHVRPRSDWLRSAWQSEVARPYETLRRSRSDPYRNLTPSGGTNPAGKEAFMLGFVVALGFGVIALMGLYATGLLI